MLRNVMLHNIPHDNGTISTFLKWSNVSADDDKRFKKNVSNVHVYLCRIIPHTQRSAKTSTPSIILPPLMGLT